MPTLVNVLTGRKSKHFCFVEMSVFYVFNALQSSCGSRKVGISDVSV